jgi:hypothetical protein
MPKRPTYQELHDFLQAEIYGAFASYGRNATADNIAHNLTTRLQSEFAVNKYEELDPLPYKYWYNGLRSPRRVDQEDEFKPRKGYEQDERAYGAVS